MDNIKRMQLRTPVVIFTFKRIDTTLEILKRIAQVKPKKLYIVSDYGRDEKEVEMVLKCRHEVEKAITWECEVIKDYALENRGVYKNIGEGALNVFEKEEKAIFLEDDNLPEASFFAFCEEMLEKYESEERILWICGTNYLGFLKDRTASYGFTKHMLPCGWASWGEKFIKYYDCNFSLLKDDKVRNEIINRFETRRLYRHYKMNWDNEIKRIEGGLLPSSWDYQMCLSIRANDLLGILPYKNQIRNIGVDENSTHLGNSMENIMTRRFCGMSSYSLNYPIIHPEKIEVDTDQDAKLEKIIVPPLYHRIKVRTVNFIKKIFKIGENESIRSILFK